jgi:hypothetical protein
MTSRFGHRTAIANSAVSLSSRRPRWADSAPAATAAATERSTISCATASCCGRTRAVTIASTPASGNATRALEAMSSYVATWCSSVRSSSMATGTVLVTSPSVAPSIAAKSGQTEAMTTSVRPASWRNPYVKSTGAGVALRTRGAMARSRSRN